MAVRTFKGESMTGETEGLTRHDLEAKLVKRCWEDEDFRKELVADPQGTFVKYLDLPAASLPTIAVHQEEPGSWHIVLPAKPAHVSELSDQELEQVAGGFTPLVAFSVSVAVSATVTSGITARPWFRSTRAGERKSFSVGETKGWQIRM